MNLRIFKYLNNTKAEGPKTRFCIWVQGCSKRCKGCFAKELWSSKGGYMIKTSEILEKIFATKNLDGITFLGGEPFEQAHALSIIAKEVKKRGLSVITFSGNTYNELKNQKNKWTNKLLKYTDLLIDGEYIEEKTDYTRPWVGSSNQNYIFLTDRFNLKEIMQYKNKIEIRIEKDGTFFINGLGDFNKIKSKIVDGRIKLP